VIRLTSPTAARSAQFTRLWLTLFALFAFTLQAYVAQSHIHQAAVTKQLPGKVPAGDDQANCPLCQATLHGGIYLTPSAASFAPPILTVYGFHVAAKVATALKAISHSWTSRGPPQA
jgi:hypothetical protein